MTEIDAVKNGNLVGKRISFVFELVKFEIPAETLSGDNVRGVERGQGQCG